MRNVSVLAVEFAQALSELCFSTKWEDNTISQYIIAALHFPYHSFI